MASFVTELWESVFTPGTTPALIKATHASFILLIISLSSLVFLSRSIHFINLLVISILLYASVIWFVHELQQAKLKDNPDLVKEGEGEEKGKEDKKEVKEKPTSTATKTASNTASPRKRKV